MNDTMLHTPSPDLNIIVYKITEENFKTVSPKEFDWLSALNTDFCL